MLILRRFCNADDSIGKSKRRCGQEHNGSQWNLTEILGWKQIKGIFPKIEIFLKMGNREMFYTYKKSVGILI